MAGSQHEFYYRWEWRFQSSPEALWPFAADTNRFNCDTGLPHLQFPPQDERQPNAYRRLHFYRLGVPVEWDEEPFEWARPYRFGVIRRYRRGPVAEMRVDARLTSLPQGGTHLDYQVWAYPRNIFGLLAIPIQIGILSMRSFDRTFRKYDRIAASGDRSSALFQEGPVSFTPAGPERLRAGRDALITQGLDTGLVDRLVEVLEKADDLAVARLRPYALADLWGVPRRPVLELCLWATRVGLLEFRWELLCPLCRGAKDIAEKLGALRTQVHCQTCNIDATANFDRSVELAFRPSLTIRSSSSEAFCVAGPEVTPHIVAQQLLKPGEERELSLAMEPGRYRLRALEMPGGQYLSAAPGGLRDVTLGASAAGWPSLEPELDLRPLIHLHNQTPEEQLLILERMAWSDQATTAAEVAALQTFRDLFSNEALRPGEQVSVGSMTIVFTDLRDSTRMYREIGDARAFGLVMSHFDVLRRACDAYEGAVVKTIGDAIMGVFRSPGNALRAMLRAQWELAHPGAGRPFFLRVGIHYGPCVAVNLNDRLDYFGSTVNIAARLEALSTGEEIVLSDVVRHDLEVIELIKALGDKIIVEQVEATLKGFDQESFELYLVVPRERVALVE